MTEVERAVETLTKSIIQGAKHEVNNASYDVTSFGVIKSKGTRITLLCIR